MGWEYETDSAGQTAALGRRLGRVLGQGDTVVLEGELGAGKTTFVRGAAESLGYGARVHSPSYSLINVYQGDLTIYHIDLYRLDSDEALFSLGLEDYLYDEAVCFIEWADKALSLLPPARFEVRLKRLETASHRRVTLSATGIDPERLRSVLGTQERRSQP